MSKEAPTPDLSSRRLSADRLYWAAIAGVVLYVILDVVAQALPPHYSPIRDAESDLAVGPYGFIMAINFLNRGLLSFAFITAVAKSVELSGGTRSPLKNGRLLLGIWAAGAILLALFPTDVPATPVSWHGSIHLIVAIVAFVAGAFGTLVLARHLEGTAFGSLKTPAMALGGLAVLLLVVDFFAPFVAPHFAGNYGGLLERLFLGSVLLWILVVSAYMVLHRTRVEPGTYP